MASVVTVDPTGNPYIDGLLGDTKWSGPVSFTVGDWYGSSDDPAVLDTSQQQRQVIRTFLIARSYYTNEDHVQRYGHVTGITNISLVEKSVEGGDIFIYNSAAANPLATGSPPSADGAEVVFGTALDGTPRDLENPQLGNYAYLIHLQMVGAALGLKVASAAGGAGDTVVPADRDALEYTVMSHRSYPGGPASTDYTTGTWDNPQTYMALDILALQTLYGADYSYYATDDVYTWDPANGQMSVNGEGKGIPGGNKVFMTIWDGGGVDTYDFSNYGSAVSVDLAPGGASLFSASRRASLGDGVYARGNVYNAYLFEDNPASLIENAIGGTGNDTLRGNIADNVLNGGAGADTMTGLAGNDGYVVDHLGDIIVEAAGEGTDIAYVRVSGYVLPANVERARVEEGFGNIEVWGNSGANLMGGNAGNDTLHGGAGADELYGNAGNDRLDGGTGADAMIGGLGNDTYVVDSLSDVVFEKPGEGTDTLWTSVNRGLDADFENIVLFGTATDAGGNSKANIVTGNELGNNLYGGGGSDSLYGKNGNDRLFGEAGNDYMTGGRGTDAYYGGAGYDYAIIETGGGVDYFVDWNVAQDRVAFDSDIFSSIGAVLTAALQSGTDVVIWDGADGIVLQNAKLTELTTSNFIFV
ncbi:M10 family metallopeptidase C-terminal domain-containing protein [Ancylobacter oerskovii]|uniref:M10 family metallopeptidase C-terminal domain-containing protein n=1 Tax=Ancylobacter oerskovii TaxID=459519 RepID=A0ABW4YWR2_9HYPH|nr:M10 family metallopeptidase C-terminal domain-containing protein [Ancylobacter oerskovii]MBS7542268.1 M10 family metallopeptidase C-terminal domain-containing protein [Ancylobacter oerskovii]